ncbi:MAG: hypothetical protein WD069_03585 [Planctomycetales bacterium]
MGRVFAIVCLLAAGTLAVYAQTAGFDVVLGLPTEFEFVNLDDPTYVVENEKVTTGLTPDNVAWALRTTYFSNWHPLTWLSYMLDAELYRPESGTVHQSARGFHATNVALHLANVLLLYFVLRSMTGNDWRGAAVAGLFAVHPLHVESVAWIAERKDVLSQLFGLLAIGCYARFARTDSKTWYSAAVVAFAASLMSKQMLVTLPCVLVLLDWWPLGRIAGWSPPPPARLQPAAAPVPLRRIALEKLPFLALSIAASVAIVFAQKSGGAMRTLEELPLSVRALNAPVSYAAYMGKLFRPLDLAVFYPHPGEAVSVAAAAAAGTLLAALTALCFRQRRDQPYLLVGWLWFLGTLVPVIGVIQVGRQQLADRYMYFPAIGIYLAIAWSIGEIVRWIASKSRIEAPFARALRIVPLLGIAAAYLALIALAWSQAALWRDGETLYRHALEVTRRNSMIHLNLAADYDNRATLAEQSGRSDEVPYLLVLAFEHNQAALEVDPDLYDAHYNLGTVRTKLGMLAMRRGSVESARHELRQALVHFGRAAELDPESRNDDAGRLRVNWGSAWRQLASAGGASREEADRRASELFREAIEFDPGLAEAHANLGSVLLDREDPENALVHFLKALNVRPDDREIHRALMLTYLRMGRHEDARRHAARAGELDPGPTGTETPK